MACLVPGPVPRAAHKANFRMDSKPSSTWGLVLAPLLAGLLSARATGHASPQIGGRPQEVFFYPGGPEPARCPRVLFVPGDGGMWGQACLIAHTIASWGYDVYALDTKEYLESFTDGERLGEEQVMDHFHQLGQWVAGGDSTRVALVGWSEGAGLGLLAAAAPQNKGLFSGLIAIGLSESSALGWHWQDDLTYLTKNDPDEPEFPSAPYLPRVAPLPLLMIQASEDVYVSSAVARGLFALAGRPKCFALVRAEDHRFSGNEAEFYRVLRAGLEWLGAGPQRPPAPEGLEVTP